MADKIEAVKEKAAEAPKADAKTAAKETVKKTAAKTGAAAKKAAAKTGTAAKKAAAKTGAAAKKATTAAKKTVKKAAEKTAAKKAAGDNVVLQYAGKDVEMKAVLEACKADYKAQTKKAAKNVSVYVKPEENAAYYVVGDFSGKVDL